MQDNNKLLIPGEKINLVVIDEYNNCEYLSKVEEIHENGIIDVLIPISKKQMIYIKKDAFLKVIISRDSAIFEFKAKLVNKVFGKEPLLQLDRVSEIIKIQRRNYYRLKIIKQIKVRKVVNIKEKLYEEYFSAALVDLSGGGIGINSTEKLDANDIVEINMELSSKIINMYGRVVRIELLIKSKQEMYNYGIHFEKITEIERNIIMRFIFDEQRKLAKKGLI